MALPSRATRRGGARPSRPHAECRRGCAPRRDRRRGRTGGCRVNRVAAQNGRRSPATNGWRITGTSEPGMRSSTARSSGMRQRRQRETARGPASSTSGSTTSTAARCRRPGPGVRVARPSTTCTSRPHTPVSAQSRTDVVSPSSSGTSERPCVRCRSTTPNRSAIVACRSTLVVSASHVAARRRPASEPAAGCGRAARTRDARLAPDVVRAS